MHCQSVSHKCSIEDMADEYGCRSIESKFCCQITSIVTQAMYWCELSISSACWSWWARKIKMTISPRINVVIWSRLYLWTHGFVFCGCKWCILRHVHYLIWRGHALHAVWGKIFTPSPPDSGAVITVKHMEPALNSERNRYPVCPESHQLMLSSPCNILTEFRTRTSIKLLTK